MKIYALFKMFYGGSSVLYGVYSSLGLAQAGADTSCLWGKLDYGNGFTSYKKYNSGDIISGEFWEIREVQVDL